MKSPQSLRSALASILAWIVYLQQSRRIDAAYLRTSSFRDLQETPTQRSSINLFLSLSYVDSAIADSFETNDLDDDVVSIFCDAVHSQAGGSDVALIAIEQGVILVTDSTTRDCRILESRRLSTGLQGLYTLELSVIQSVLASTIDSGLLTTLIETGFNSVGDSGGTFMNLLKSGNDFFDDLEEARAMVTRNFSSITPSNIPSFISMPTSHPMSDAPSASSQIPSSEILKGPSISPTTGTTSTPTISLTQAPSASPSLHTSSTPTSQPRESQYSLAPTSGSGPPPSPFSTTPPAGTSNNKSPEPTNRQVLFNESKEELFSPLIIVAIALGSLAAMIFCCCLVRLVCCSCMSKKDRVPAIRDQRKSGVLSSHVKPAFVPKVVEFDEDNQSLANTTLGEHTAGRNPPKKRAVMEINTSFDESVYTSSGRILPSYHVHDATISSRQRHRKPLSTPDRKTGKSGYLDDSPTLRDFSSRQTSFFARSDRSQSDTTDSPNLDFATDFPDDPFFGDDEGMLGAMAPSSPVADRIEDMVTEEMRGSDSEDNSSSADNIIGNMDLDSPLDLLRLNASTFMSSDDDNVEQTAYSTSRRKIHFETIYADENDVASQSTRSSVTEMITNKTHFKHREITSKDENTNESLSLEPQLSSRKTQRTLVMETTMEKESIQNPGSSFSKAITSANLLMPMDSRRQFTNADHMHRSQCEDEAQSSPIALTNGAMAPSSPIASVVDAQVKSIRGSLAAHIDTSLITPRRWLDRSPHSLTLDRTSTLSEKHPFWSPPQAIMIQSDTDDSRADTPISSSGQSSGSSEGNSFLFKATEETLGPLSAFADMKSLAGRSGISRDDEHKKVEMNRLHRGADWSAVRNTTQRPFHIQEEKSEIAIVSPRTLAHDIERLENQLHALRSEVSLTRASRSDIPMSVSTASRRDVGFRKGSPSTRTARTKNRVVVTVPPGKLGIVLANRRDGVGAVVAEVKSSSSLKGVLSAGDKLVAIDGVDVTGMVVSQITAMMMTRAAKERHLTVITASNVKTLSDETKHSP